MADLLQTFPDFDSLRPLIQRAREEDMGDDDVTSRLLIEPDAMGTGLLVQKRPGVVCGLGLVEMVCACYDPALTVWPAPNHCLAEVEGRYSESTPVQLCQVRGPLRALLSAERVILNFLQRLSGIATVTRAYVQQVQGTAARILDTRKTTPGLRTLEKYAVRAGGGVNHRMGLYDGLLVKDNHLARLSVQELAGYLVKVVAQSRAEAPRRLIEVEVDTLEQLRAVLTVKGIDVILLDNMNCPTMTQAVALRDHAGLSGKVQLEASGGVSLQSVRAIALTGVERISVGALTHSAPALDISMDCQATD